jgi:flavin-dependent dehydrogenase
VIGTESVRAQLVLLATGVAGLTRRVGIGGRAFRQSLIAQQWCQPASAPLPALGEVELHWLRGGYIGLATPKPNECVIALASGAPQTPGESAFELLRRLNPRAPLLEALPADAPRRFHARGTAGFPWLPERLTDRNLMLIGDAAGYAEPYSGAGISQAFASAACAASAILQSGQVAETYESLMRRVHQRVFWRTRLLSRLLQCELIHWLGEHWPLLPSGLLSRLVARVHVEGSGAVPPLPPRGASTPAMMT